MSAEIKVKDKRLEALREELEAKEKECEKLRNQMLRLQADFENAKKRWLKEQAEFQERANEDLLRQFLELVDDFERALVALGSHPSGQRDEEKTFRAGVEMIAKRLKEFLKSYGVLPMEAAGKIFDPNCHEAVAHEETAEVPESTVLSELRKGYMMNGRVLRPAVVKVAVKPVNRD